MQNREGRVELERLYGEGCFMERAGIRKISPEEEKILKRRIKGFKVLNRGITYHHLQMKSKRWKGNC